MRLVYFGTPADAVGPLRALHAAGHDVVLVVTQPDRRRGRGSTSEPSAVRRAAEGLGLPVRTPARSREVIEEVAGSGADAGVVVAFGQLLPEALLRAVPLGFVNLHFSLLPRWRGAAPVERAILAGDAETGVCVMAVDATLDTGAVFARASVPIGPDDTAGDLRARLVERGTALLVDVVGRLASAVPEPQVGEATYAEKLDPAEFHLDWRTPATELDRIVRAGNPKPGAWTTAEGRRLKVWRIRANDVDGAAGVDRAPGTLQGGPVIATGEGLVELLDVQPEGKRAMAGDAWYAGTRGRVARLGT
jgi:methionyl-tRNA formyltransferase